MGRTASLALGHVTFDDRYNPLTDDFESKERNYIHFDLALKKETRANFSITSEQLLKHSFWPLLGYKQEQKKLQIADNGKLSMIRKPDGRPIKFGSHKDAAIYQYYAKSLNEQYEKYLKTQNFAPAILAYRANVGDNITCAHAVFEEIKSRGNVTAIAIDIKSFFDKIDHRELYQNLAKILGGKLDAPNLTVFKRITKYEWVDSVFLESKLKNRPRITGRLCTAKQLRELRKLHGKKLIQINKNLFGIPQGTPMSGLYANISMIEFDRLMFNYITKKGGSYRRYSDDIIFLIPEDVKHDLVVKHVNRTLQKIGLKLNNKKTEISKFNNSNGRLRADRAFQYLGFTFDGQKKLIRNSSLKKYHEKMHNGVWSKIYAAKKKKVPKNEIYLRDLFKKYTYFGRGRNFPQYAYRASRIMGAPEIKEQVRTHMKYFKKILNNALDAVY